MESRRRNHYDVTNQICIADPNEVCHAVIELLARHDPALDVHALENAFLTFTRLHAGDLPGYAAADTPYHDAQHSLDCTLGAARLIGERFVNLERGTGEGTDRKMPPGGFIPVARTQPALDLDALIGGFRPLFRALDPDQIDRLSGQDRKSVV